MATIFPLGDMARNIGGGLVEVSVLLPPRANPHSYEPLPSQARDVSEAGVLIEIGIGMDNWAQKIFESAARPDAKTIVVSDGLGLETGTDAGDPDERGPNPHIWLDPVMAQQIAEKIVLGFMEADPKNKEKYRVQGDAYIQKLKALDEKYRQKLGPLKARAFITLHPAWEYLARRYGLIQRVALLNAHGEELSPGDVRRAFDIARKEGIGVMFVEPELNVSRFGDLARDFGVRTVELEPIGDPNNPQCDSYIKMMEANLERIVEAFGG